jgi:hypothetical protein
MQRVLALWLLLSCAVASAQPTTIPYTTTASGQQIPTPSWVDIVNNNFSFTPAINGTPTPGDCVTWTTSSELGDAGAACGSGGGGGGNVSTSGTVTQYETPAFASSTLIKGIGPGTLGTAFCSGGASAYPSFCTSLSGVTSVNGSTIPANATIPGIAGSVTTGHCVSFASSTLVQDAGTLCGSGGQLATITSTTTLTSSMCAVLVNATSGNITVTLPTAVGATYTCIVKRTDSSSHTVTINTTASQTIDGQSSVGILFQYTSVSFMSDNANWWQT